MPFFPLDVFHRGGAEETPRRDQRGHPETGAGEGALETNGPGAEDERGSENEVETPVSLISSCQISPPTQ